MQSRLSFSAKSKCKHPDYSKQQWDFFFFFFAFEDNPTSISPQLPLKHNRCLPTRLPSTSCLVTTGPLLSTTECLANSMSELNLETPLIYPPHWIDRSWLHRGSLSRVLACWISTQGPVFLILKSKSASYYKSTVPLNWGIRENSSALSSGGYVLLITTIQMLQLVTDRVRIIASQMDQKHQIVLKINLIKAQCTSRILGRYVCCRREFPLSCLLHIEG